MNKLKILSKMPFFYRMSKNLSDKLLCLAVSVENMIVQFVFMTRERVQNFFIYD